MTSKSFTPTRLQLYKNENQFDIIKGLMIDCSLQLISLKVYTDLDFIVKSSIDAAATSQGIYLHFLAKQTFFTEIKMVFSGIKSSSKITSF